MALMASLRMDAGDVTLAGRLPEMVDPLVSSRMPAREISPVSLPRMVVTLDIFWIRAFKRIPAHAARLMEETSPLSRVLVMGTKRASEPPMANAAGFLRSSMASIIRVITSLHAKILRSMVASSQKGSTTAAMELVNARMWRIKTLLPLQSLNFQRNVPHKRSQVQEAGKN